MADRTTEWLTDRPTDGPIEACSELAEGRPTDCLPSQYTEFLDHYPEVTKLMEQCAVNIKPKVSVEFWWKSFI